LVEKLNGVAVLAPNPDDQSAAVQNALTESGFARTPRGLRLR
jgi:ATP-dependent Lhr-like helicase